MTKLEDMQRLDEWERKEIVRRVTEEGVDVELACFQVRMESNKLYREIVCVPGGTEDREKKSVGH